MNDLLNKWYKNHALAYKVLLFVFTTTLIVYVFPKSGKFKYDFNNGKPWQSENLYAPFDFAVIKSEREILDDKNEITNSSKLFFNRTPGIKEDVLEKYNALFYERFNDTVRVLYPELYDLGHDFIITVYDNGIVSENYSYPPEKKVVILENKKTVKAITFSQLVQASTLKKLFQNSVMFSINEDFEMIFISIFYDIIEPNIFLDQDITQRALEESLNSISVSRGKIQKETLIISKGEIVDDSKFEILKSLESEYQSSEWGTTSYNLILFAYALLVALALLMLLLFLKKYRLDVYLNNTKVTFIFFNVIVMIILTTTVVKYNSQYVYVVPLSILPLVLKAFFDARLGLFTHVLTVLLLGFVVPNSHEYIFLQVIAGIVTILTVSELYKRANLFISVGQITGIYILAYFSFFVIHQGGLATFEVDTILLFILCGLATLFVQPLIYIYEKIFGLVSDVSLLELSDRNSTLLKRLSNEAPGTFHHSLNVANLAEAACNEIGANAMLASVGALYHDIGKMTNPTFFSENQSTGYNPHDELDPVDSAKIITDHVINGIEIAKKYNLPDRVIDFIRSHHGTSLVYYFYSKAQEDQADLDINLFKYRGPKPYSRETAIVMMCDSVEAASKSMKEPSTVKIDSFVEGIIGKQVESRQFLNADITFQEIESIKKVLKNKLANMFHLRIEYPE